MTYTLLRVGWRAKCYYRVSCILLKLRGGLLEILWLDRIIPPVHLFGFVTDDLHSCHRVHPCPSQVRAGRVAKIVEPEPLYPRSSARRSKGRPRVLPWLSFIQEDSGGVEPTVFP